MLVQQCCSRMITMLLKHCSGNHPVTLVSSNCSTLNWNKIRVRVTVSFLYPEKYQIVLKLWRHHMNCCTYSDSRTCIWSPLVNIFSNVFLELLMLQCQVVAPRCQKIATMKVLLPRHSVMMMMMINKLSILCPLTVCESKMSITWTLISLSNKNGDGVR